MKKHKSIVCVCGCSLDNHSFFECLCGNCKQFTPQKRTCQTSTNSISKLILGKNILITGGTGSIGQAILRQVLVHHPKTITVFSHDQMKQHHMANKYSLLKNIRFRLGDIRNIEDLMDACNGIDIVFHTAALKDAIADEIDPIEAIKTNVLGTRNIVKSASEQKVSRVVNISTDKAVEPSNVLGATKILAERLVVAASRKQTSTIFCNVRFGNVLGSRGSIIPTIQNQIWRTRTVTITDPKMTRFIMTIDEAASLVLHAMIIAKGGETIVMKMKSVEIGTLIQTIKSIVASKMKCSPKTIKENIIGSRFGEKTHEKLVGEEEIPFVTEKSKFFIIDPNSTQKKNKLDARWFSSKTTQLLNCCEISKILDNNLESSLREI